jgi:acylphosphatase
MPTEWHGLKRSIKSLHMGPWFGFIRGAPAQPSVVEASAMKRERVHVFYSGRVQGVGFRFTVKMVAHGFDVTGTVRNLDDGRVEMVAEGDRHELEEFLKGIQDSDIGAFIRGEETTWSEAKNEFRGFEIIR